MIFIVMNRKPDMKSFLVAINILIISFLFSNCNKLLITRPTKLNSSIMLQSDPSGASVRVNGVFKGITPLRLTVQKTEKYNVELSKDGYHKILVYFDGKDQYINTKGKNIMNITVELHKKELTE